MSAPRNVRQYRPSHHDMRWQERALCRDLPSDLFFPGPGEEHTAIAVCLRCPVRIECLSHALQHREDDGIWGGATAKQRRSIRRTMRRAKARAS